MISVARIRLLPAFVSALAACQGDIRSNPLSTVLQQASAEGRDDRSEYVFRLPAAGGEAHLYNLPALAEESWRFDWGPHGAARAVGFAGAEKAVYALTAEGQIVALDLETGRSRVVDSLAVSASVDAADRTIVVHEDGSLVVVDYHSVEAWPDTLEAVPSTAVGGAGERIVAVVPRDSVRDLMLLRRGEKPIRQPLPNGAVAVTRWGDFAAVATDSGLVTLTPDDPELVAFVPLAPKPRVVAFSPSGHHVYVVLGVRDLVTIDRFEHAEVRRIRLAGRAGAIRVDPLGRMLLVNWEESDSLFVVYPGTNREPIQIEGSWDSDLPVVTNKGTVLVRRGQTVVALSGSDLSEQGSVPDERRDQWLSAMWNAVPPQHQIQSGAAAATARPTGQVFYVQVSSSRNPVWAEDFAQKLRAAGMTSLVLQPEELDELYHVVLGPYTTRQEADRVGRSINLPFWILTRQGELPPDRGR